MSMHSRLQVGIDVPWVTGWSEEQMAGARPCASVGGRLALHQAERPGWGRPIYSMNHCRRQRESVARMLCPMCGQPTVAADRWTLTAKATTAGALRSRGLARLLPPQMPDRQRVQDAGSIAPMHKACAQLAWGKCPHLSADPTAELASFAERWLVTPLMVEAYAPAAEQILMAHPPEPVAAVAFLQLYGLPNQAAPRRGALKRSMPARRSLA